jgi:hypothetical protein
MMIFLSGIRHPSAGRDERISVKRATAEEDKR